MAFYFCASNQAYKISCTDFLCTLLENNAVHQWKGTCSTGHSKSIQYLIKFLSTHQVLVTNTVLHDTKKQKCSKIKTIDISLMIAEAIRRIHHGESMSHLFRNIPLED